MTTTGRTSGLGRSAGGEHSRRLRRSLLLWLLVVVVLVSGAGTALNWVFVDRDPEDPVEGWLDAVADGRSRQGLALTADPTGGTGNAAMPNAAYRQAGGRIDGWEIVDVQRDGDTARVTASVRWPEGEVPEGAQQGEEHTWSVHRVSRTGPLNDRWELDRVDATTLTVEAPGIRDITLNGEEMSLDPEDRAVAEGGGGQWVWEAMPGRFAVGLPEDGDYIQSGPIEPAEVSLQDPEPQRVSVGVEPSPRLWAKTDETIAQRIEGCMRASSVSPDDCPVSRRWAEGGVPRAEAGDEAEIESPEDGLDEPEAGASISEIEWELVSRPSLLLVPDDSTDSPLDWVASDHGTAEARLSYLEGDQQVEEIVRFPVRAEVRSDGSDAEIDVALE